MRVIGWRAWVDGKKEVLIFDSKEHEWSDIPDDGILYIMLYKDYGDGLVENLNYEFKEPLSGDTHYFKAPHHSGDDIYASNEESKKSIKKRYPGAEIKKGKWVPLSVMEKVRLEALCYVW